MTYEFIKEILETESGIEDIGIKSRKAKVRDARYCYARLCEKYVVKFNQTRCGKVINRDHSTIIHSLKMFRRDYNTINFSATNTYNTCDLILKDLYLKSISESSKQSIEKLKEVLEYCETLKTQLLKELEIKLKVN